jgi:hypothetical protein
MAIGLLILASCAAKPKGLLTTIPSDTPAECAEICGGMGMQMTAVVVAASNVGCVCEKNPGASKTSTAAVAAATTAVIASEEASQAAAQQQPRR